MAKLLIKRPLGFAAMLEKFSAPINFAALGSQGSITTNTIVTGVTTVSQYNHKPNLAFFGGKFFCCWATGLVNEDASGQRIRYATSDDGASWSSPGFVSPAPATNFRYLSSLLWERNGILYCFASLDESNTGYFGASLKLQQWEWSGTAWINESTAELDTIMNHCPELLDNGKWLTAFEDHTQANRMAVGDIGDWTKVLLTAPSGSELSEPDTYVLPDGRLACEFRDGGAGKNHLLISFSEDGGVSWSAPKITNFPDAQSNRHTIKLSDGRYALISNPDNAQNRIPLCVAISTDGQVYGKMTKWLSADTTPRFTGGGSQKGYSYPHAIEVDGVLYIVYSENKEDIKISSTAITNIA